MVAEGKGASEDQARHNATSKLRAEANRPKYRGFVLGTITTKAWQRATGEWVAAAQADLKPKPPKSRARRR